MSIPHLEYGGMDPLSFSLHSLFFHRRRMEGSPTNIRPPSFRVKVARLRTSSAQDSAEYAVVDP